MMPSDWKHVRLDELSTTVTSGSRDWAKYYADQGSKFIRMTNLQRDNIYLDLSDLKFVDVQSDSSDGKRTSLKAGDILMSITAELGKIGWVHEGLGESFINQHTALIRLNEDLTCSKYIAYLLSSKTMNQKINRLNDSGAKAGLNLPTIRSIPLDIPTISEQRKIADILSTWDKAISITECQVENSKQQKKALMQQLLTSKKRLLDDSGKPFEEEWKKVELGKLLDYKQPTPYLVKSTEYSDEYTTPVLTAGKTFLLGYSNEDFGVFREDLPAIIFDDFTTASKFVDFPFKAKSSAMKILIAKEGVSIKYIYEAMQVLNYPVGGHQRHWISIFSNLVIGLPTLEEQQKIAAVLSNADKEVKILEQQLADLKQEKKALMQQLLTGKRRVKV